MNISLSDSIAGFKKKANNNSIKTFHELTKFIVVLASIHMGKILHD